jgi:hypothetical protein
MIIANTRTVSIFAAGRSIRIPEVKVVNIRASRQQKGLDINIGESNKTTELELGLELELSFI